MINLSSLDFKVMTIYGTYDLLITTRNLDGKPSINELVKCLVMRMLLKIKHTLGVKRVGAVCSRNLQKINLAI